MKICACFAFIIIAGLAACMRPSVHIPAFSTLNFTGNARSERMTMPLQGVLTNRDGKLKFVVAAVQGVVLGYGTINPEDSTVKIIFSRSGVVRNLLETIGEALLKLFPMIAGNLQSSGGWRNLENLRVMVYSSPHLELTVRLEDAP